MGAKEAPHWLLSAFVRSVMALGATAPREQIEEAGRQLLDRWSTEDRHHHGVAHLVAVLERVDSLAQETHNPEVVRVAAWYHGAVFDTRLDERFRVAGENKPASAALARAQLLELGVPEPVAARVHELILNLRRHDADPGDVDCMALCDADLGTLSVDPQRYKAYRRRVREEFAHIPVRDYLEARIAIVSHLLARRSIFTSPLASPWEESARQNLSAELVKLKAELATLPPREESEEHAPADEGGQPSLPPRGPSSRFGRAPADTATIPVVPAVEHHQAATLKGDDGRPVPAMVPVTPPSVATPGEDDEAEVVGVPFEDRKRTTRKAEDLEITSAMERVPQSFRDVPRRPRPPADQAAPADQKPPGGQTPASASSASAPSASAPSAPSPAAARSSTEGADDAESTGTLFRPPDR
jgi:predicted metal-dependent HD superfamily phosphohydrolase